MIAIAGPYSAETTEQRRHNLDALNKADAAVMMRGHVPVVGVNAALPVLDWLEVGADRYESVMAISLALVEKCEVILVIGESPGANRERELIRSKGLPIYGCGPRFLLVTENVALRQQLLVLQRATNRPGLFLPVHNKKSGAIISNKD